MKPEDFALHNTPVNQAAFYTVYRPNQGYKDDRTLERCEEYDNVTAAIQSEEKKLNELKNNLYILQKEALFSATPETRLEVAEKLAADYDAARNAILKRLAYLQTERQKIKEKYGIIKKLGVQPSFQMILIEELYREISEERFKAAVRRAKKKFENK